MKKILALVLAMAMVAGVAAPSFAAEKCVFRDASMCVTQSISSLNNDDN